LVWVLFDFFSSVGILLLLLLKPLFAWAFGENGGMFFFTFKKANYSTFFFCVTD